MLTLLIYVQSIHERAQHETVQTISLAISGTES